jgi:hypothetical protein
MARNCRQNPPHMGSIEEKGVRRRASPIRLPHSAIQVGILGWSSYAFGLEQLQQLRTELRLPDGQPLPHAFVRHADEQTLAALAVALQLREQLPPLPQPERWGVLAAPEYFGKEATLAALQRYSLDGPGAISPHLIPNHCLHSLSGSLSVLLGLHGPNYGVGGGPGQLVDLLLAGMLETVQQPVPGFWLVATGWRTLPGELGLSNATAPVCLAMALAVCRMTSEEPQASTSQLRSTEAGPLCPGFGEQQLANGEEQSPGADSPHRAREFRCSERCPSARLSPRAVLRWQTWPRILDESESPRTPLQMETLLRALHTPIASVSMTAPPAEDDSPAAGTATRHRPAGERHPREFMVYRWYLPEVGVLELRKLHQAEQLLSVWREEAA